MSGANVPIDFVISWVDGNDPVWLEEKRKYQPAVSAAQNDSRSSRYRDWDNLRYWFRSVEKYAPWVRKIHLVTWGHVPAWLNLEYPKLHHVRHSDYIPDKYLPVFSSHPIELNLHRIPDLADHFVYFNDDFFLTAPVSPEDFFVKGLPCDSLEESPVVFLGDYASSGVMNSVNSNDLMFASRHFDRIKNRKEHRSSWYNLRDPHSAVKNLILRSFNDHHFFGLNIHHLPQAYIKKTFEDVWEIEPELMDSTCSHRFRNAGDVSQCVFKFYQLLTGQFYPYNKRKAGVKYTVNHDLERICHAIESHYYKFICINDSPEVDFDLAKKKINSAFESVLPEKGNFEK